MSTILDPILRVGRDQEEVPFFGTQVPFIVAQVQKNEPLLKLASRFLRLASHYVRRKSPKTGLLIDGVPFLLPEVLNSQLLAQRKSSWVNCSCHRTFLPFTEDFPMQLHNFTTIDSLARRVVAGWRHRYLTRWQTSYLPRLTWSDRQLPRFVHACAVTMPLIHQFRLLAWERLPGPSARQWLGQAPVPLAAYIGSYLVKLTYGLRSTGHLRQFLIKHPALIWALWFPLVADLDSPYGFDPEASLPTRRQFNRALSQMPNSVLQLLLDGQVFYLQTRLPNDFGQIISLDTKAILAWVKENNPKQYIKEGRFDKTRQPAGDPDCKLGCKRRHNRQDTTPHAEGKSAAGLPVSIGEFYWGYASGVVVTKLNGWGEFVLAEMTQTFDKADVSYFFPLMAQVERRLGFRPHYGALDAAFDAFYVYDYFHNPAHEGFAAVAFSEKGGKPHRHFDETGLPLCDAGLAMPLKFTFTDRTTAIIPYERAKHVCPLLHPQPNGQICPIAHKNWVKGGCTTHIAHTVGARIRHQLDRKSDTYKAVYNQRTAVERINSQAVALGIERPKLRSQPAIVNQNTLIYLLINLQAIQRVLAKLAETSVSSKSNK